MSLPTAPSSLTPAQRKAATVEMLVEMIVRRGDGGPVLLILEDAHWIDATTLELMTRLIDRIASARLLAVVTGRTEFTPPWQARPHATLLMLGRLGRADCARLVADVAAAHGLSVETIAAIVAKTDGVPLFAEELTKSVIEQAGQDGAAVPATLKDSLMARLDRLGEARDVAQLAAVIGRQFSFALLDAVALQDSTLETALAHLVAAGIVFPEGRGVDRSFSFKHALVRDAAYESLLLTRRRELHARIARALDSGFPDIVANEPELLAYHFGEAGLAPEACDYRARAGDRAVARSAYHEAIANFTAGIKAAEGLADPAERMRRQLDFLLKIGAAQTVVRGLQSDEAEDAYRRAAELGERLDDGKSLYRAKWGLWLNANFRGKTAQARDRAGELIALAERSGDSDELLEARHCRWSTGFISGDVAGARADSTIGANSYDMARHRHLGPAFGGHDVGVCANVVHGMAYQLSGEPDQAKESVARGLAIGEALDHPNSIGHALMNGMIAFQLVGNRDATLAAARRASALAEKYGLLPLRGSSALLTAWVDAVGPGIADAARIVDAEIGKATAFGALPRYFWGLAAEIMHEAGRPADGIAYIDRAIATIDEPGIGFYLPELYRWRGRCLLALGRDNKDEARRAFTTAQEIAERQGALIFLRRAETALAELVEARLIPG